MSVNNSQTRVLDDVISPQQQKKKSTQIFELGLKTAELQKQVRLRLAKQRGRSQRERAKNRRKQHEIDLRIAASARKKAKFDWNALAARSQRSFGPSAVPPPRSPVDSVNPSRVTALDENRTKQRCTDPVAHCCGMSALEVIGAGYIRKRISQTTSSRKMACGDAAEGAAFTFPKVTEALPGRCDLLSHVFIHADHLWSKPEGCVGMDHLLSQDNVLQKRTTRKSVEVMTLALKVFQPPDLEIRVSEYLRLCAAALQTKTTKPRDLLAHYLKVTKKSAQLLKMCEQALIEGDSKPSQRLKALLQKKSNLE